MSPKTKWILRGIFLFLLLAMIAFIFSNSARSADESSQESGIVVAALQAIFEWLHLPLAVSEFLVRKSGHFLEFFALGTLLCINIRLWTKNWWGRIFVPITAAFLVAATDETIQLFSPGRSSEVRDVWVDVSGAALAICIITPILFAILDRRHKKKHLQHE